MFVLNCTTKDEESLFCPSENKRKSRKRKREEEKAKMLDETVSIPSNAEAKDIFHPVQCSICKTEVAVVDLDEVYHFFNVLASHT